MLLAMVNFLVFFSQLLFLLLFLAHYFG